MRWRRYCILFSEYRSAYAPRRPFDLHITNSPDHICTVFGTIGKWKCINLCIVLPYHRVYQPNAKLHCLPPTRKQPQNHPGGTNNDNDPQSIMMMYGSRWIDVHTSSFSCDCGSTLYYSGVYSGHVFAGKMVDDTSQREHSWCHSWARLLAQLFSAGVGMWLWPS